ncbi:MAG: hypothetical protein IJX57_07755, partial [Clostridia bacterium]|nr:hypothetical protein [Clostridia bacterium]
MKKLLRLLYSNKFAALFMFLIQLAVFVGMFVWISDYSKALVGFSGVLGAVLIILEVNSSEEPTFKA